MELAFHLSGSGMHLYYNAELYKAVTTERMIDDVHCLIETVMKEPERPLYELPVLSKSDSFA